MAISKLYLTGAALNAWIEFTKANRNALKKNKVVLTEWADAKKGAVKYQTPVFTLVPLEDAEAEEARRLDGELQEYFGQNTKREESVDKQTDKVYDVDEEEPINLDDIPF